MLTWLFFVSLFLLCAGMSMVFLMYICALWYVWLLRPSVVDSKGIKNGLSALEMDRLLGVKEGETVKGAECAVCLDEIEEGQIAQVMPECSHVFHRWCVDSWLSENVVCLMCRIWLLLPPPPLPPDWMRQGGDDAI